MNMFKKLASAVLIGTGALAISGCATGLPTQVSRYQSMPAPAGQTFYVVPANGVTANNQFNRYAAVVAQQLAAVGYTPAGAPQLATMVVKLDYGVDQGKTEYSEDPFARSAYGYGGFGYGDPFYRSRFGFGGFYDPFYGGYMGRPYWSHFGYWGGGSPFYYGWDDPFWYSSPYAGYGAGFGGAIRSYTVYKSYLDLDIVRKDDNAALFEGHAKARSETDNLGLLVPNLIEAMFTGFPGRSGETVRITVPPPRR